MIEWPQRLRHGQSTLGWQSRPMAIILALLGLLIGSHIAVVVVRWPNYASCLVGRSRCDTCERTLSGFELVPLVGAILLRGRCRSCAAEIPKLHWRIEITASAIGLMAGLVSPVSYAAAGVIFGWQLLTIASIDLTRLLLPNLLNLLLAVSGLLVGLALEPSALVDHLIGGCGGFVALWVVRHGYRLIRGREGLGGGDPKLLGAIGCWLGWQPLPILVLAASLFGLAYVALELLRGNRFGSERRLPFGALLAAAAFATWFALNVRGPT